MENSPGKSLHSQAFTLIEIVIALSVIAFCIVPLIGALGVAYQQARESQEKTEVALVFQSMEAILQGSVNRGTMQGSLMNQSTNSFVAFRTSLPRTNYFAEGGRHLGTNVSTPGVTNFFRCITTTNALATNSDSYGVRVVVEYPAPSFNKKATNQFSLFRYGTRW
jgi:prepilin-type N-terminal cleavage/methylation domain-containing protein